MTNTKAVNTTILKTDHKRAVLSDICWTEALTIGINVLCGDFYNEEKRLQKEVNKREGELIVFKKQLESLKNKREEKAKLDEEAKKKKENSCADCGSQLTKQNTKDMGDKKVCKDCFLMK